MIEYSEAVVRELSKRNKYVIRAVEIYPRNTDDITSIGAPAEAIARYSDVCFTWTNATGSYEYEAKVLSFPDIGIYFGEQIGEAEVELSNAARGENSTARFFLNNQIKGCWMVIRLIFPDEPDEEFIVFWGKCQRPGKITSERLLLRATQEYGNLKQEVPFRNYQVLCPLEFARSGGGCLGDQTIDQKSITYQENFALYSTSGCNKRYSTCVLLGNEKYFQGQRVVAASGQFSYVTVEEVVKRVLFWTKRKKIQKVKTDNWSSVNQSESSEVVPLVFGRAQIQGHPFTWADEGTQVFSMQGFCEGKISAFTFTKCRIEGISISGAPIEHLGDWGGVGTQALDRVFNGASGYNSRLAYLEIITDGSSPTQTDDAPLVTSVIRGLEVPLPDTSGAYTDFGWTNNPVHYLRFLLTDPRFGRIPENRIDDEWALRTAADCDEIVEDRTNDEAIVLPSNEYDNYGIGYRRFRSSGRYTAYKDMYVRGEINQNNSIPAPDIYPEFDEPMIRWFNPFEPYVLPPNEVILRQKYTLNGALQEKTSILELINTYIRPTFKGFMTYGQNGKIQIKNRRKADNGYIRFIARPLDNQVAISNIAPWKSDFGGYLLIGASLETAEIRKVTGFTYSTACNGMDITSVDTGTVTSTTSMTLTGGSQSTPAIGWVSFGGSVSAGAKVEVTFDSGVDEFKISYSADGTEDLPCFARMFAAFMNANPQFRNYLTAYITDDDPNRINVRCEVGYLLLDGPLEYTHEAFEEVIRVQAVFENCGELTANTSAQFDNIIEDSFEWNDTEDDEINAVVARYTSAIDDFQLTNIIPRAAWDTIDLEGEINKKELDLTFVDNYWQAAYLAKGEAIESIDGNLPFSWETSFLANRLELGDVVAIRHDSGDGALNYVPVWITSSGPDLNSYTIKLTGKLYLSAAFDYHVQPIDVTLTTTLNSAEQPDSPPPTVGTSGGVGGGTEPVVARPSHTYYEQFQIAKYSPTGVDVV